MAVVIERKRSARVNRRDRLVREVAIGVFTD
jgi:hypothetical protein